jgi:hypothetical protein
MGFLVDITSNTHSVGRATYGTMLCTSLLRTALFKQGLDELQADWSTPYDLKPISIAAQGIFLNSLC